MAEYIEREAIKQKIDAVEVPVFYADGNLDWFQGGFKDALKRVDEILEEQPTADVQKIKHGKAIQIFNDVINGKTITTCSCCNGKISKSDKYCKHCGAKMDKEVL